MSPVAYVRRAIAEGRITVPQAETALGVVLLLHAEGPGAWSRATYYRRRALCREIGLDVEHWPMHPDYAERGWG